MNNKIIKFGKILIVLIFAFLVLLQAGKKFTLDELDFPIVAEAASQTGVPIYYRGEGSENHLGIYHPPLYIYALAGFIKIFSYNEYTIRIFGLICTLLTSFFAIKFYSLLFPKCKSIEIKELIFLAIFLLHPYTIANTTLPDIDQTVLPLFMLGYIYFLAKFCTTSVSSNGKDLKNAILLGSYFSLVLWCKLTTPLSLIPLTFILFYVSGFKFLRSAYLTTFITLFGSFIFITSYYLYCLFFNLPLSYTFGFLLQSFSKGTAGSGGIDALFSKIYNNLNYGLQFIYWLTPEFILLTLTSLISLIRCKLKEKGNIILMALIIYSLTVALLYLGLISPFGRFFKYPYPVIWILAFSVADFIVNQYKSLLIYKYKDYIILYLIIIFVMTFYNFFNSGDAVIYSNKPIALYQLIAILFASLAFGFMCKNITIRFFILLIFTLMISSELAISSSQAVAKYPTKYEYGQLGLNETIDYLKDNVYHNEVIWSMKDVGYYVNNRYVENYADIFTPNIKDRLVNLIQNNHLRYFVVTKGIGEDRVDAYPELKYGLENCCVEVRQFGNFVIYKARDHE